MDYVLYFGRYSEEKGIGTLIKVCKELPDVQFIFAGTGPLEESIKGVSNIKNVGFQKGEALEKLIREARFSIYPSEWYENCPFSVMESQMYGTLVLGADIGGIPELIQVGKTGELFESGNAEDLKKKIEKLWGDKKLCAEYSANCKDISFDTIDEYYEKIMKVYQKDWYVRREFVATKADRYEGIDGLKAYAIIGIALMHVLANGEYGIGGFVFERLIPSFTNLVFLFMMVSGFGMCCGYYQKIVDQKISVEDFYKKRYIKIWPYFALLCELDFVISPSKESLFEVFANLTLCQGLLPNAKISVIGVSWTLAVIFVFYMLFPFFCFLIGNKKRAWGVAVAALVFNWLCTNYFKAGRTNIVYDAIYFIAGGLIFLYRKELAEFAAKYKVIAGAILLIAAVAYFALGGNTLTMLFFCVAALVYTLGCKGGGTGQSSCQVPRWYQL